MEKQKEKHSQILLILQGKFLEISFFHVVLRRPTGISVGKFL